MKTQSQLVMLITLLIFSYSFSEECKYGSAVVDSIISVYDGDTFRCNINGFPPIIGENISIRFKHIDTPEIRGSSKCEKKDAYKIRDYVEKRLRSAKTIVLKNIGRPKYFRLMAEVFVDGVDLGKELVRLGYAYKYEGGTKKDWVCIKDSTSRQ